MSILSFLLDMKKYSFSRYLCLAFDLSYSYVILYLSILVNSFQICDLILLRFLFMLFQLCMIEVINIFTPSSNNERISL